MNAIVSIKNLTKSYANGFQALKGITLDIREGEILALLGPGSNPEHWNHFHFDLRSRKSGKAYCD